MRLIVTADTSAVEAVFRRTQSALSGDLSRGPMAKGFAQAGTDYLVNMRERFKREGDGWKQLEQVTKEERTRLGFPAAHPILRRDGWLYRGLIQGQPGNVFIHHKDGVDVGYGGRFLHPGYKGKRGEKTRLALIARFLHSRRPILVRPDAETKRKIHAALHRAVLATVRQQAREN